MAQNFRKADRLRKFFNGCEITMETFERELCVRGYHVYQRIWTAVVGEVLHCEREPTNSRDRYAVAVKKNSLLKNIPALNFRRPGYLRKYCNNENFPIYGISPHDCSLLCPAFETDIFSRDESLILYYSLRGLKIAEIRR